MPACAAANHDCLRSQAVAYAFDGWDLATDLGPRRAHLIPVSASSRSTGPSVAIDADGQNVSAFFNASNHEYFAIPPLQSLFLSGNGDMTLGFWIRCFSSLSSSSSIFELGNGYRTENVYVRVSSACSLFTFGITHSASFVQREHTVPWTNSLGEWIHVAWVSTTLSTKKSYDNARWSLFFNGILQYTLPGVVPIDATYSFNFIGFSTDPAFSRFFFTGAVDDLRLYERALHPDAVHAIFSRQPCCQLSLVSGAFIDASRGQCTGRETFNPMICKPCRSDCGSLHYIFGTYGVCTGTSNQDTTECKPCKLCREDQFMGKLCSGTSFDDDTECFPCR